MMHVSERSIMPCHAMPCHVTVLDVLLVTYMCTFLVVRDWVGLAGRRAGLEVTRNETNDMSAKRQNGRACRAEV